MLDSMSTIMLTSTEATASAGLTSSQPDSYGKVTQLSRFWRKADNGRFADSFGNQLSDLNGKNRWTLVGQAKRLWDGTVLPLIDELVWEKRGKIHKKYRATQADIIRHCWMIGSDKAHAWPTVVVCCNIQDIIDRTAKVIAKDKRVKEFGFKLLGVLSSELKLLTSTEGLFVRLPPNDPRRDVWSLCGRRFTVNDSSRQATMGGVIIADGVYYGLTVAHAFFDAETPTKYEPADPPKFFEYDLNVSSDDDTLCSDDEEEFEEEDEQDDETIQHSPREHGDKSSDNSLALQRNVAGKGTSSLLVDDDSVPLHVSSIASPALGDESRAIPNASDWALISLDGLNFPAVNEVPHSDNLFVEEVARAAPSGKIFAALHNATVSGVTAGSACSIKFRGSATHCTFWPVELETSSCPGDSGAWIVDPSTGDLFGALVAECSALNMNYMVPTQNVFQDMRRIGRENVRLPTIQDSFRIAIESGNKPFFQHLVATGACKALLKGDTGQARANYHKALVWAAANGLDHGVSELLKASTPSTLRAELQIVQGLPGPAASALHAAAAGNHPDVLNILLQHPWTDINILDANCCTPLFYAAQAGHTAVVELLLERGAIEKAHTEGIETQTVLQAAAQGGHLAVVERLLAAGADVNAAPARFRGRTALQAATDGGHLAVVERLLAAGADVNAAAKPWDGRTALQAAAQEGHLEVVNRLLEAGAEVNAPPARNDGRTALQAAAQGGHLEVVDRLLEAGALVDAVAAESNGRTALQAAAQGGHLEVVNRLLEAGAQVNAAIQLTEQTALQVAARAGHVQVVERLLKAGASVDAVVSLWSSQTILQAAAEGRYPEAVKRLITASGEANMAVRGGRTAHQGGTERAHAMGRKKGMEHEGRRNVSQVVGRGGRAGGAAERRDLKAV